MNPFRKSKKHAIKKINTINISQKKNTKNTSKRGHKKKVQKTEAIDNRESNTIKETKQSYKNYKEKKIITPQSQIIDKLLNDSDSSNEDDNNIPNKNNNNSNKDDNKNDNNVSKENSNKAYEAITPSKLIPILEKEATGLMSALEIEINRRLISVLEEIISKLVSLDLRANNQNEFLFFKLKSALKSRTDSQNNFTFSRRVLSRLNSTQLDINSQEKILLRLNSRPLLDINSQDDDYFIPSRLNSRLNSRSLSDVNSQDNDYFTFLKRRTNSPDYYDPSNRVLYSKPMRPSPL
ncbi:16456_t:CDS:2, partial [Funneliformis mosseae]